MKELSYVKLQNTQAFIPGVGQLGDTLPSPSKNWTMKMYEDKDKVLIRVKIKGKDIHAVIPFTNVQIAVYASVDLNKE